MSDLLVIGVGGAGKHIAYRTQACVGGRGLAVNTESESLRSSQLPEKLLISSRCYADEAILGAGEGAASIRSLRAALYGTTRVLILAGLGGRAGSGAMPLIAKLAQEKGCEIVAGVCLPFSYEKRREVALDSLGRLKEHCDSIFILDFCGVEHDAAWMNLNAVEAFAKADAAVAAGVVNLLAQSMSA